MRNEVLEIIYGVRNAIRETGLVEFPELLEILRLVIS
jgi:hypothetical protein